MTAFEDAWQAPQTPESAPGSLLDDLGDTWEPPTGPDGTPRRLSFEELAVTAPC